jgi:arginyl-tRNA synthetase
MEQTLSTTLITALHNATQLPPETLKGLVLRSHDTARGDFSFPCFILAKSLKIAPPLCAQKVLAEITLPEQFERAEAVGPYLNFYLKRAPFIEKLLAMITEQGNQYGKRDNGHQHIIVEYSSPNIAKPFHIGHLRATLIGLALDRVLRHSGYKVTTINHLGDWGTQFGFVFAGCEVWGRPSNPTVDDLVDLYKKANALRKAQDENTVAPEDQGKPNINAMARDFFTRLEAGQPEALSFWQWALDISMEYYTKVYKRVGAEFDFYTGESFYRDRLGDVEQSLKSAGILSDSNGALGVDLGKLGFVRVFTEDGRSLYITRDLATADYRYKTFNPDHVWMVVGNPQELYLKQLFAILEKMHHPIAGKLKHIGFGYVPGISTRKAAAGDEKISLGDLLEDAHVRALEAYRAQVDKRPEGLNEEEIAESVGLSAVFFDYLSRTNNKDFHFNWETALNFQGDTGPYILYALARINSIQSKAQEQGITPQRDISCELLTEESAYKLVALMARFPAVLDKVIEEQEPYHLALFALEMAKEFSSSYRALRVLGEPAELATARLTLFVRYKEVLERAIKLLGMRPVERM